MIELISFKQIKKEIKKNKIDFIKNNIKKDNKLTKKQKKFESKNLISKRSLWTEKVCEFYDIQIKYPDINDIPNEMLK